MLRSQNVSNDSTFQSKLNKNTSSIQNLEIKNNNLTVFLYLNNFNTEKVIKLYVYKLILCNAVIIYAKFKLNIIYYRMVPIIFELNTLK